MDELELRLAAVELVIIELGAWLDPQALQDAAASIRAGLEPGPDADERTIRLQALQLLEDARKRYSGPEVGLGIMPHRDD